MNRLFFLLFIFFQISLFQPLFADTLIESREDSLLNNLVNEKDVKEQINNYLAIINFYQNNNIEKSIELCDQAINFCDHQGFKKQKSEFKIEKARGYVLSGSFAESSHLITELEHDLAKINDDKLQGELFLLKNLAYINLGEFSRAMDNALNSIIYFKKVNDVDGLAEAYNHIGIIYDYTNNYHKALENYLKSKEYATVHNNLNLLTKLDNNIGIIYDKLNDTEKALSYYYKALENNNTIGNLSGVSTSFNNIASLLTEAKRYDEALTYYKKALDISLNIKNQQSIALLKYNLGELYYKMKDYNKAEKLIDESNQFYIKANDSHNLSENYKLLAQLHMDKHDYNKAKGLLMKTLSLTKQTGVILLQENTLSKLGEIYAIQGNYEMAFKYLHKANILADSLQESNKTEELKYSDFQIEFQNQSDKFENDLKRNEELHKKELQKQKNEKYATGLMLALIIIVALMLYRSFSKSSRINKKLLAKNREVEDQKELIEISNIELREQYTFTETLLNTIPNPVFYTDRNSHLLGCNKAFEEITGKFLDEFIGVSINTLELNFDISCDAAQIFGDSEKKLIRNEGTLTFADGSEHDVICYRKGIIDSTEKLMGVLGIIIDITDIREAERKLKHSQTQLKEAINAKDKFFNIMAHDLKNPFNAVLGLTSLISKNFDKHSEQELKEYIDAIYQSSNQIYSLLENLLEWARAQSGSIEKNPTHFLVNEVIQNCINLFNHSLDQKKLSVSVDIQKEFEVVADKNMIMTVLRNLLSNAIKYTDSSGYIAIHASQEEKYIKISVIDSGVGIMPDNLDRLFKIDQPVSTPGIGQEKGTGLGLIISQEFVKQNGGKIEVSSKPGKGSTFSFTVPLE